MEDNSHPLDMSSKVAHHIQPHLQICLPSPPEQSSPSHPQTPPSSPPPLTKIVKKTPSSPREFFAKLYGPDTNQDTSRKPTNPIQILESPSLYSPPPVPSFPLRSYLPTFPLPPHQSGMMTLENIPFPAGLVSFCKSIWY